MAAITFDELTILGNDIDNATDARDTTRLEELDGRAKSCCEKDSPDYGACIWYFRSNIQAALQDQTSPRSWEWRQKHRERQIDASNGEFGVAAEETEVRRCQEMNADQYRQYRQE